MSRENDRSLRFYHEVLGLKHLHYGLWDLDDPLSYDNLKRAQQRYEDFLIENLPKEANSILDVGCGTSSLSMRMHGLGLDVEGLSPDINQKQIFTENLNVPFHHTTFEKFEPQKKYDCLIMSESAQYIPYTELFKKAIECLKQDGHLLVCDYFVKDNAQGLLSKSGHRLTLFLEEAKKNNFMIAKHKDLTDNVVKTLELAKLIADRGLLAADIASEKFRTKHPVWTKLVLWTFRKKIAHAKEQMVLIDSGQFKENKRYNFYLFQYVGK